MQFDENNAYEIIKRISFPRLVGSDGERKARNVISEELNKAGYDSIKREKFETGFYNLNFIRHLFLFTGILIVLLGILFYLNHLTTILLIFLMIIMIIKCHIISSSNEIKLSRNKFKRYETENIYVNLRSKNSKAKVILLGHYDSKGQTFSISLRKILFSTAIFGIIITMIIYIIFFSIKIFFNYNAFEFSLILLIVCITVGLITIINFFNKTNNISNGASDNGSSVGILIELARYFKKNPINNLDIIFLFPSSEEINLGGSKIFLDTHKNELDKADTYFINYDVIGTNGNLSLITNYGYPKKKVSSIKLKTLFFSAANELDIDIKNICSPFGIWSDYLSIVNHGFEACWLSSLTAFKKVHTLRDNIDLISKEAIKNILNLSVNAIKKLDKNYGD